MLRIIASVIAKREEGAHPTSAVEAVRIVAKHVAIGTAGHPFAMPYDPEWTTRWCEVALQLRSATAQLMHHSMS